MRLAPLYYYIVAMDVAGSGARTDPLQLRMRADLRKIVADGFAEQGIDANRLHQSDLGDGLRLIVGPETSPALLLDPFVPGLADALRRHRAAVSDTARLRLRLAVHGGPLHRDSGGWAGRPLIECARMLDAAPVRRVLAVDDDVDLVLVVSQRIYDDVVSHGYVLDPAMFHPVGIAEKETTATVWIYVPGYRVPPGLGHGAHPHERNDEVAQISPAGSAVLPAAQPAGRAVPRQLPAVMPHFVGRETELQTLNRLLDEAAEAEDAVLIPVIAGMGGIGKTWLALHWAHQQLRRFPDGQLFVDLHGFDPSGQPVAPASAVRGFLDALGVPSAAIPAGLDAQIALYRSAVAGRRMLIVLDNARDTAQVVGLLPGSPTCTAIVTSRDRLVGLVATRGAHAVPLDVLNETESHKLLARRLGDQRVAAEPNAATRVMSACTGLPLALAIAAAHTAVQPQLALETIAEQLCDAAVRLDALDADDPYASLRTVLSCSSAALTAEHQQVFGLLGLAPGPDIGLPAAAALTGLSTTQTTAALRALDQQSLIQQHRPGRWRMHELVRLYAGEQASRSQPERNQQALHRVVDFYVDTANLAERMLEPGRRRTALDEPAPDAHPHPLPSQTAASAWLEAEHSCLLATQRLAEDHGWHRATWQLAWALDSFYGRRGQLHDLADAWTRGLAAARHVGDAATQARAHRLLGETCSQLGRHGEAADHLDQALALTRQVGDLPGQAHTHYVFARASEQRGDDKKALEHAIEALALYRSIGDPQWEDETLNAVGWYLARLGRYEEASGYLDAARALTRRNHDREGEAAVLDSLGYLAHHSGQHFQALHYYRQARDIRQELHHTYDEAGTLERLGETHAAMDQQHEARQAWQQALQLYSAQHRTADADRVKRQLDRLNDPDAQRTANMP
jgi:tetratricopeptide (TPR) repeat protein